MNIRVITAVFLTFGATLAAAGTKVTFDSNGVCEIDGKKMFVISIAVPPPAEGKTPDGKDAIAELKAGGCNYMRVTVTKWEQDKAKPWTEAGEAERKKYLDKLAENGMYGWIYLYDLGNIKPGSDEKEAHLKAEIEKYKDHPANGGWKGADEPAWGKVPPEQVTHTYKLIKDNDPDHPVLVLHAPKGEWRSLVPYMAGTDVTGADIFPIAYPPGRHGDLPNREISVVGDYTKWIKQAAGKKPVWMTLQVAWSGVGKPGKALRFPTRAEERFMTYEAIINGARGVNYFGGGIETTLNERDKPLGYNWTFWENNLKPVLAEINDKSPLYPALIAPDSTMKVQVEEILSIAPVPVANPGPLPKAQPATAHFPPAKDVDVLVRETESDIFILAAKREGATVQVRFAGLPGNVSNADVLFESPRKIKVESGVFDDWFGPDEVHVYRIKK